MPFGPTLITLKNQLILADFNQLISDLAHNSTILGQNHNLGHFSHSIFVTKPDSAVGIKKFQEFWNFLESMESLRKYDIFGLSVRTGHFSHSNPSPRSDSDVKKEKFMRFQQFGIYFGITGIKIPNQ